MCLSVLNIRSSSTDPGTITVTNSSLQTDTAPLSTWLPPHNPWLREGLGEGVVQVLAHYQFIAAAAGLASSAAAAAAAAARLEARAALSEMKGGESGTSSFMSPPHHSASPCVGAVPQRLDV